MSTATRWVLIVLTAEKIVQHGVVSWALIFDRFALRTTVAVDYRWLAVAGVVAGVLFAVTLVGLVRGHRWSLVLLAILATADLVGEFVAQGTLMITITLSFVVALIILVLSLRASRRVDQAASDGG